MASMVFLDLSFRSISISYHTVSFTSEENESISLAALVLPASLAGTGRVRNQPTVSLTESMFMFPMGQKGEQHHSIWEINLQSV